MIGAVDLARARAASVGLSGRPIGDPSDVVRHLVVVQSQDFGPGCWSVAHRSVNNIDRTAMEQLFDAGVLLRTHALRPTWHFVLPDDIGWLLELTGPRVQLFNGPYYRREGLDQAVLDAATGVLAGALAGRQQTRAELAGVLGDAGIDTAGLRLALIMMNAELEGVICSGARRGQQHTYALLAERAPQARRLTREDARDELVLRYFVSHGPSTPHDMNWWSSLTLADIRAGIEAAGDRLRIVEHDGVQYWSAPEPRGTDGPRTLLLQSYDEYVVGYSRTKWLLDPRGVAKRGWADRAVPNLVIITDTAVIGGWRVVEKAGSVQIDAALHLAPTRDVRDGLDAAGARYGQYVGKPVQVVPRVL